MNKTMERLVVAQWARDAEAGDEVAYKNLFFYYAEKKTCWQKLMEQLRKLRRKLKIVGKNSAARGFRTILRGKYMRKALTLARKQQKRGYALEPAQAYYLAMDILYDKKRIDKAGAIELLEEAAAGGLANAAFQLGCCYDIGRGVMKNPEKAKEAYREAVKMGSPFAAIALKFGTSGEKNM